MNPFLSQYTTPHGSVPFDKISISDYENAMQYGIEEENKEIANIISNQETPTFDNTILALEKSGNTLRKVTDVFFNQLSCETSDSLDEMSEKLVPLLTEHSNSIMLNTSLFKKVEAVVKSHPQLTDEEQKLLEDTYDSFLRHGAALDEQQKQEYDKFTSELSVLKLKFAQNKLKEQNGFILTVTNEDEISGIPQNCKDEARAEAQRRNLGGWAFTLHAPSYIPFMEYCDNRELRKQMYMAYNTIGAKGNSHDNRTIVKEIVNKRLELARLLGYSTYSDYILEERMAQNCDAVFSMLGKLTWSYLPAARKEMDEIVAYAKKSEGEDFNFERWDFAYYSEKLKEEKYSLNDEHVRPYFELNQAIHGAFYLATRLYGVTFKQNHDIPVFNPDVKVWEVYDYDGSFLALLYCDFFARKGKHAGAWMDSIKPQYKDAEGNDHRPHITLSTNYRKPLPGKPTLLNHDEFNTLMHEFGHCMHGILSDVIYPSQCSPNVLWDFVELPSQIMENFSTEEEFLKHFAFHHKTGENIPQETLAKIKKASTFKAAYQCVRQVGLGLIDQAWHNISEPFDGDVLEYEQQATAALRLMPVIKETGITPQFGHIMSGGYAAGYYSYKWAEVLDADAYSRFKKEGVLNMKVAQSFRDNVLSQGGHEHPMKLYIRFRGHKPEVSALIERMDLKK